MTKYQGILKVFPSQRFILSKQVVDGPYPLVFKKSWYLLSVLYIKIEKFHPIIFFLQTSPFIKELQVAKVHKGQLISKCPLGVFKSTKKPTQLLYKD